MQFSATFTVKGRRFIVSGDQAVVQQLSRVSTCQGQVVTNVLVTAALSFGLVECAPVPPLRPVFFQPSFRALAAVI